MGIYTMVNVAHEDFDSVDARSMREYDWHLVSWDSVCVLASIQTEFYRVSKHKHLPTLTEYSLTNWVFSRWLNQASSLYMDTMPSAQPTI